MGKETLKYYGLFPFRNHSGTGKVKWERKYFLIRNKMDRVM